MTRVRSFAPVADRSARILILGSMPGVLSLQAGQYYAHPRNAFWPVMGRIFGFDATDDYAQRLLALRQAGIAVWDVLQECLRPGSLDSAIEASSCVPNDFASFYPAHPLIRRVCFNGAKAEQAYRLQVPCGEALEYRRLPSTSTAHAALTLDQKTAAWRVALTA